MKSPRTPPLLSLLAARARMLGHVVTGLRQGGVLKFVVVSFFGVLLVSLLFQVMGHGFRFLRNYPVAETLVPYLFSIYFLTMLLMLTFSNAVISFGALYRSPETQLLMAMPLESHTVYNYKAGESLMFSSWAFLILGGPLLAAYGNYGGFERLDWTFYAAAAALIFPFVFVPASLGSIVCMLLTRFFPRRPGRALGLFFAVAAMICIAIGGYLAVRAGLLEDQPLVNEAFVQRVMDTFAFSQSTWAPSYWVSEGLMRAAEQNWPAVAFHWGLIASTAAFLWMAGDFLAEKIYAASYSRSSGAPVRRLYRVGGFLDRLGQTFSGVSPVTARLVVKDVRTFTRDPVQWSQVLIFFGLLFIYVANLRNLGYQRIVLEHIQNLRWTNFVAFANLTAAGLTLATLTTRFVFPMISVEGKRFWILSLLPVRRSRLLLGKYVFSLGGSLLLMIPLVLLGAWMLGTPARMAWIHFFTAMCMCVGLPGIAVGMGAVFPNYREESPAKIVSGFGGTLCLVLSISFVGLLVASMGWFMRRHILVTDGGPGMSRHLYAAMGVAALLSLLFTAVPLGAGCREINRAEL